MNTRYDSPEVIANVEKIDTNGESHFEGDKIVGVSCDDSSNLVPLVTLDIRNHRGACLMVRIELTELLSAIGLAAARMKGGAK